MFSISMGKIPTIFGLPEGEGDQAMLEKVWRICWRPDCFEISRTRHELMAVGQQSPRDQRGILERANPERYIHALGDLIDNPICDEHMYTNIGVGRLKGA